MPLTIVVLWHMRWLQHCVLPCPSMILWSKFAGIFLWKQPFTTCNGLGKSKGFDFHLQTWENHKALCWKVILESLPRMEPLSLSFNFSFLVSSCIIFEKNTQEISHSCSGSFAKISNATCHCEAFSHAEMAALNGVQLEVCRSPSLNKIYAPAHMCI